MDGPKICKINKSKPLICVKFPSTPEMIKEFPSCSYSFKMVDNKYARTPDNKRYVREGVCNQCGECCTNIKFNDIKYRYPDKCPYLTEVSDGLRN